MSEEKKFAVKINKNHGGKEFSNYFRFIGKVKKHKRKEGDSWVEQPFFEETVTSTNKPRRVLQFVIETAKGNELKIENNGMKREFAYLYSSTEKKSHRIEWENRKDKTKYPNETYHLLAPEWDLVEELEGKLKEGEWVEVKGRYEFDSMIAENGSKINLVKRMVSEINPIENGQEIRLGQETFKYVTDFESPDFKEVNTFRMQIGIRSTYQNPDDKNTKVNAVYLEYGKERSTPKEVELMVFYKEPEEGKSSLADAFGRLNHLDFLQVEGVDNNRGEFTWVEVEDESVSDNPFDDVDEDSKAKRMELVTTGRRKGLEITSYVQGTLIRQLLSEDEITPAIVAEEQKGKSDDNPLGTIDPSDLPF